MQDNKVGALAANHPVNKILLLFIKFKV